MVTEQELNMKQLLRCCVFCVVCWANHVAAAQLYVFVPSNIRAVAMQKILGARCPDLGITVFGRVKDFSKRLSKTPPDAILTLVPVIKHHPDYSIFLQGYKVGLAAEAYVLVSVDKPIDLKALHKKKIGVVDILGRKAMSRFMQQLFGIKLKIKRVMRSEDLLPLLIFRAADAIFVSELMFAELQKKSNLNLKVTQLDIKVGLAATAQSSLNGQEYMKCITAFPAATNTLLGVEKWERM